MFQRNQAILTKLLLDRRERETQHQPVIREILVTHRQNPYPDATERIGDFATDILWDESDETYIARTLADIEQVTAFAVDSHLEHNFWLAAAKVDNEDANEACHMSLTSDSVDDANAFNMADSDVYRGAVYALRPDKRNEVTRVSFNEYYFYPHEMRGPLSEWAFQQLVSAIEQLATRLPENLHLLLASFPVCDTDGFVTNLVLYVQCGTTPCIDVRAKTSEASKEPWYPETRSWSYCPSKPGAPVAHLVASDGADSHFAVKLGAPILCKTHDTTFWTAIDICLDHELGAAVETLFSELAIQTHPSQFLPIYATHIVTSNTILLVAHNALCRTVTHVDPKAHTVSWFSDNGTPVPDRFPFSDEIPNADPEINTMLHEFQSRPVDLLAPYLLNQVKIYNAQVLGTISRSLSAEEKTPHKNPNETAEALSSIQTRGPR